MVLHVDSGTFHFDNVDGGHVCIPFIGPDHSLESEFACNGTNAIINIAYIKVEEA